MEGRKNIGNDGVCKTDLHSTSKPRVRKPRLYKREPNQIRINKGKGGKYIQIDPMGWITVGKATPENFAKAIRWLEESRLADVSREIKERAKELGERHGILKTPEDWKEYKRELNKDEGDTWLEMQEVIKEGIRAQRERHKKQRKRMWRKFTKALRIPDSKYKQDKEEFEAFMKKDPDLMTPEQREYREELKKAYEEGRLILT